MSAALAAEETRATYAAALQPPLVAHFDRVAQSTDGVARLRELILSLAVQGKLVPQDPADEPASALLERIRAEKAKLVKDGTIRKAKPQAVIAEEKKPFALPTTWEWSRLADVGMISPRNDAPDDLSASFVQMSSIPAAFGTPHLTEERPWRDIKSGFTHFAEGDVGLAKITPCFENGKSVVFRNLANGIGAGTTELHIVRPLGSLSPDYVLIFLKTPRFLANGESVMTGSAGQKRLPRTYFESTPFPVPPLAEQSRIVARVEELMALCDALEAKGRLETAQHARLVGTLFDALAASESAHALAENWQRVAAHFDLLLDRPAAVDALEQTILQLAVRGLLVPQDPADEPASALLQRIRTEKDRLIATGQIKRDKPLPPVADDEQPFELPSGWEWATLNAIATQITDGAHHTPRYVDGGIPFLSVKDLSTGQLDFSSTRFISIEEHNELTKRCYPELGDILLTKIGTTGIAVVIDQNRPFSIFVSVALIKLRHSLIDRNYLSLVINSPFVRQQSEEGTEGVGNKNLVLRKINAFEIPFPPLAEQSRIVARVAELRALCADLRQRLAAARETQSRLAGTLVESALA